MDLFNGQWFSLNKKGEHYKLISFAECLDSAPSEMEWAPDSNSRFAFGTYRSKDGKFKTCVQTQFLTPGITYTMNLLFKMDDTFSPHMNSSNEHLIVLRYKLQGETKTSISYLAGKQEDEWWKVELYQFNSEHKIADLEILFDGFSFSNYYKSYDGFIYVEGIEFRPLKKVDQKYHYRSISDSDANGEAKLPIDYEDIKKWATNSVQWTTKKEAYSILRKGFLLEDSSKKRGIWLFLDKHGRKCHMMSAVDLWGQYGDILSFPESRFGEVLQFDTQSLRIDLEIPPHIFSSESTYAAYIVYKLQKDQSIYEAPIEVEHESAFSKWYIYLVRPQTPTIRPKADQNTHNPQSWPKLRSLPQQRNDGWMEVQIWEFKFATTPSRIRMNHRLTTYGVEKLGGLTIEGIEFRPV